MCLTYVYYIVLCSTRVKHKESIMGQKRSVSLSIDVILVDQAKVIAKDTERSLSYVVGKAIKAFVEVHNNKVEKMHVESE